MAYDPHDLNPNDPTSPAWALAWARRLLNDTGAEPLYAQAEVYAVLNAHAFVANAVTYYRPHYAAAALIASDPDRATAESLLGASVTVRDPGAIARSIRSSNAWVDDLIETVSGERPPSGRQLRAVF